MNVVDIVNAVSAQTGLPKGTVKQILSAATQVVASSFEQGNRVCIYKLGFFYVKEYPPRPIYNPRKKELVMSAGTTKVIFKQSPKIKIKYGGLEKINKREE